MGCSRYTQQIVWVELRGKKKTITIFVKIFDAQIQAIAKYGAEIWGLEKNVSTEEKKKTASICCEKVFGGLAG